MILSISKTIKKMICRFHLEMVAFQVSNLECYHVDSRERRITLCCGPSSDYSYLITKLEMPWECIWGV